MITYDTAMHVFRTPAGNPATMHYRVGTNDWNTLTSCLTEDEYGLPTGLAGTAADIGGHLGSVGIALALDNPDLRVIIVEPVPPNCDLITRNILQNRVEDRVTLVQGAIGKRGALVRVGYGYATTEAGIHHAFIGNLSMLGDEPPTEVAEYRALTLRDIVKMAGGHVPFLKIDTEGAEWDFLRGSALRFVEVIVGEWHNTGGHVRDDVAVRLGRTHRIAFSGPVEGPGGFRAVRK